MARIKVIATHYVSAPNWKVAEEMVERKLVEADSITSEAASHDARDLVAFGIAKRIFRKHHEIYFTSTDTEEYEKKLIELEEREYIWLRGILEEVIGDNELTWE